MLAIFKREVKSYFTSPIAYIFIAAFYIYTSNFFITFNMGSGSTDLSYTFANAFLIIMILLPLLTMRLFTEERKQKTDQCLLTAPVSLSGIVFGKFLAAVCVYAIALLIYIPYIFVIVGLAGTINWATSFGTLFALFLLGSAFISIGVFVSSLTESQVVSAIVSFVVIIFFYMVDILGSGIPSELLRTVASSIGFFSKYVEFSTGVFDLCSILFFISTIFIFNFLTVRVLEKRRWN